MRAKTLTVDIRDDIRQGQEPFGKIMEAVSHLGTKGRLLLISPFKPFPLFAVMTEKGFAHQETRTADGCWEVMFTPDVSFTNASRGTKTTTRKHDAGEERCACDCDGRRVIDLDVRGLRGEAPFVRILQALDHLPCDAELKARTDFRPIRLYAHFDNKGFLARTEEQNDRTFITYIHRS